MADNIERLIKYIRKEDVVLFIGSGFSIKAGAPKVCQIIDSIIEEAGTEFAQNLKNNSLRTISERFVNECGSRNDLIALLSHLFAFTPTDLSDHILLTKIPHIRTIFTTNYDTLIEDTYPKSDRAVINSNTGCAYTADISIYKVHGDITTTNDPDSIVITDSDYKNYFKSGKFEIIWENLKQAFVQKHVAFIGYSLEDDNILEIIKNVRDCIGNNMKQIFLIAPNFSEAKKGQLNSNSIAYIDSFASELLESIMSSLKDTIASDYRHKKVSKETYDKFCSLNAELYSTTTNRGKENRIDTIHVKEGCERKEQIKFTIPNEIKDNIDNRAFNNKINLNNSSFNIPAYKISSHEMIDFEHRVNGILFSSKEDITSLFVVPSYKEMNIRLKMPSIGFIETVKACRYVQESVSHIDMDTPIYILKIIVKFCENNSFKIDIEAEFKKEYSNSNEAIRWIQFLIGLFDKKEVWINKMKIKGERRIKKAIDEYSKYEEYYNTIKDIECYSDIIFDNYNNYTKMNYLNSKYLLNYNKGTGFISSLPKDARITFNIDIREGHNESVDELKGKELFMMKCVPLGDFELNKKLFYIPFKTTVFQKCIIEDTKAIDKYNYKITMQNMETSYATWCTDREPRQEDNMLHIRNCNTIK